MKVLVTGATGFVGGAVARALVKRGIDVRVMARAGSDLQNLQGVPHELVEGDLRDQTSLRKALTGCRQLYHVAAHYALWAKDPSIFYDVNVTGTKNLLEAARDVGTERIVYCSTIGAIGLPPGGGLGTEETPVSLEQMAGHYKRSKYLAEQEVLKLATAGLPVVIVNPSAPVGTGDVKPTPTGQVIVDFMKGRMPAYIETGMNIVDVDDVAIGHLLAMERGRIGERYILGNAAGNWTMQQMLLVLEEITGVRAPRFRLPYSLALGAAYGNEALSWLTGRPPKVPLAGVRMARQKMYFNPAKAIRELGLPQTPPRQALADAAEWFRLDGYVK